MKKDEKPDEKRNRRGSLKKTHTQFQTKMVETMTHFQTKTPQKPYSYHTFGPVNTYTGYRGVPPGFITDELSFSQHE